MGEDSPIAESDVPRWDLEADIVIVGLGAAGACAALQASGAGAGAGAEVVVLERAGAGGGASALSEGLFYLGGGTAVQEACGFHDDPENMFRFLRASMTTADENKLRAFCEGAVEHLQWLESHGVPFERRALKAKVVSSHTGEGLLTTGNEFAYPFREVARPVPRGHQTTATEDDHGGAVAMRALLAAVAQSPVSVEYDTRVVAMIIDAQGRVCGVKARTEGAGRYVRAHRGVVIATGSFNMNEAMTSQYLPVATQYAQPLGTPDNDGAGIELGRSVGAATENMHGALIASPIYPPEQLVKGIAVNSEGQRFVAEDVYSGRLGNAVLRQPGHVAHLIVDEEIFAYPALGRHELVGVWETVPEVESALGLPANALQTTLDKYNNDITQSGKDTQFRKDPDWLKPLQEPLAAFDISFASSGYNFIGLGGLRTNEHGQTLNESGQPIEGLYAAGACAAHLAADGDEYGSGLSLGPGSFFGRRAGQHAAAYTAS